MRTANTLALICAAAVMTIIAMSSCKKVTDPKSVISITAQPAATTNCVVGDISGNLSVTANATRGATLEYQWYRSEAANGTGETAIEGEIHASYTIPAMLEVGTYYYFCRVTAVNAKPVRSAVATVTVTAANATARFTDGTTGGAHFEVADGLYTITFTTTGKVVYGVKVGDFPDTEFLIGRKADEVVTLKLDETGKLLFRDADAYGNIPIGSYAEFAKIWGTGSGEETAANLTQSYRQDADLDMLGFVSLEDAQLTALGLARKNWTAIGIPGAGSSFSGSFNGDNHTLANLYSNFPAGDYAGLFGNVSGGRLSNIGIVSGAITGSSCVGGVCAQMTSDGSITGCFNRATVKDATESTDATNEYTGGICGIATGSIISTCWNEGYISGASRVGGVCGYIVSSASIINCQNEGIVTGTNNYVGGVCGDNTSSFVTACWNEGIVMGTKDYVGGVCGTIAGRIIGCYNMGNVTGSSQIGGVCGFSNMGTITACHNTGNVSGTGTVGGVCGTNSRSGTLTSSYSIGTVGTASIRGGVCGSQDSDTNNTVAECYFLQYPGGPANGVGSVGAGATSRTAAFGADEGAWPTADTAGWALSVDGSNAKYWRSLGAWNGGGTPAGAASIFPRLWWEN